MEYEIGCINHSSAPVDVTKIDDRYRVCCSICHSELLVIQAMVSIRRPLLELFEQEAPL